MCTLNTKGPVLSGSTLNLLLIYFHLSVVPDLSQQACIFYATLTVYRNHCINNCSTFAPTLKRVLFEIVHER